MKAPWVPVALVVLLAVAGCGTDYIRVSTRTEFIEAIGPDTNILLMPGEYDLSEEYDSEPVECDECLSYGWEECYCESEYAFWDGYSVVISGVENLVIAGSGVLETSIVCEPWYGCVLYLEDCRGVTLENLSMGHRPRGTSGCSSGVLDIWNCSDVTIKSCDLYGSGVEGAYIESSENVLFLDTTIRDCTEGILMAWECWDLLFEGCEFSRNGQYYGITFENCDNVVFRDCLVERNTTDDGYALFEFFNTYDVLFEGCTIRENRCYDLFYGMNSVVMVGTEIDNR